MRRIALTVLLFAMGAASAAALMTWRQPSEGPAEAAALVPSERKSARTAGRARSTARPPAQTASLPIGDFRFEDDSIWCRADRNARRRSLLEATIGSGWL